MVARVAHISETLDRWSVPFGPVVAVAQEALALTALTWQLGRTLVFRDMNELRLCRIPLKIFLYGLANFFFYRVWRNGDSFLQNAIRNGNELQMRALISGIDIERRDSNGDTRLLAAIREGHTTWARILIAAGANLGAADRDGRTALHLASSQANEAIVRLLCDSGADLDATDDSGATALRVAAELGLTSIFISLSNRGAKSYFVDRDIKYDIVYRLETYNEDTLRLLVQDWNNFDTNCGLLLCQAAKGGHVDVVRMVCEKGRHLNCLEQDRLDHALYIAAENGKAGCIDILCKHDANVNAVREFVTHQKTPIYVASENSHIDCVRLLLARGAKVETVLRCREGDSSHRASFFRENTCVLPVLCEHIMGRWGHLDEINRDFLELLKKCSLGDEIACKSFSAEVMNYLNTKNERGDPFYYQAIEEGSAEFLRFLWVLGASFLRWHYSGSFWFTPPSQPFAFPMQAAVNGGNLEALDFFHALGVNLEAVNAKGEALIHMASRGGHYSFVQRLLEIDPSQAKAIIGRYVARPDPNTVYFRTPLHNASIGGNESIVDLLLLHDARIDAIDEDRNTPLHLACMHGRLECVQTLCSHGANLELVNSFRPPEERTGYPRTVEERFDLKSGGLTPLEISIVRGDHECVRALIANGAKLGVINWTEVPLTLAAKLGHAPIVSLICQALLDKHYETEGMPEKFMRVLTECASRADPAKVCEKVLKSTQQFSSQDMVKAVKEGNSDKIRFLCEVGGNPESADMLIFNKSNQIVFPVFYAIEQEDLACVEALFANADPAIGLIANMDFSAFGYAAFKGQNECIKLLGRLARKQANCHDPSGSCNCCDRYINCRREPQGRTPLHWAVINGHIECVKTLLELGGAYRLPDAGGKTAFDLALELGRNSCIMLFREIDAEEKIEPRELKIDASFESFNAGLAAEYFAVIDRASRS